MTASGRLLLCDQGLVYFLNRPLDAAVFGVLVEKNHRGTNASTRRLLKGMHEAGVGDLEDGRQMSLPADEGDRVDLGFAFQRPSFEQGTSWRAPRRRAHLVNT